MASAINHATPRRAELTRCCGPLCPGACRLEVLDLSSNRIETISGLEGCPRLRLLNLASNRIRVIQGLPSLRALSRLNLAFNRIESVDGLAPLHGSEFALRMIDLRGNAIGTAAGLAALAGLSNLNALFLGDSTTANPVLAAVPGIRAKLFGSVPSLIAIDDADALGAAVPTEPDHDSDRRPQLANDFVAELLAGPPPAGPCPATTAEAPVRSKIPVLRSYSKIVEVETPRIDQALAEFRNRKPGAGARARPAADQHARAARSHRLAYVQSHRDAWDDDPANFDGAGPAAEMPSPPQDVRAVHPAIVRVASGQTVESDASDGSDRSVNRRGKAARAGGELELGGNRPWSDMRFSAPSEADTAEEGTTDQDFVKGADSSRESCPSTGCSTDGPASRTGSLLHVTGSARSWTGTGGWGASTSVSAQLGKELFAERQRRARAEASTRQLVNELKTSRVESADARRRHNAIIEAVGELQRAMAETEARNARLRDALNEVERERVANNQFTALQQHEIVALRDEISRVRTAAEASTAEAEQIRLKTAATAANEQQAVRDLEQKLAAAKPELEVYKRAAAAAKRQIQGLQGLLAQRDDEHRRVAASLVELHGPEVARMIDEAKAGARQAAEAEAEAGRALVTDRDRRYAELEDEFRNALRHEAVRYQKLEHALAAATAHGREIQRLLGQTTAAEARNRSMLSEMAELVKEQQRKIRELNESKRLVAENCSAVEAKATAAQSKITEASDRATALATELESASNKANGLEAVVAGLREERGLWSRELAAQGATLAADRGKLDSKLSTLAAELEAARQEAANHREAAAVQTKIVEDQSDSLRKLKISLGERDREMKAVRDEYSRRGADLEDRLEAERALSQQLNTDLELAHEKKNAARELLSEANAELDTLRRSDAKHRDALDAKAALLEQIEAEVTGLKGTYQKREAQLVAEKKRAVAAFERIEAQLAQCDDVFREQLAAKTKQHDAATLRIQDLSRELAAERDRGVEREAEMTEVLKEIEVRSSHACCWTTLGSKRT